MSVVACRGFEIWRYKGAKIGVFCMCHPSEVDRGVVNWLWFGHWSSYCPPILCTVSQEHLLRSYIGDFDWLCQLWLVEALKFGGMSGQKLAKMTYVGPPWCFFSVSSSSLK